MHIDELRVADEMFELCWERFYNKLYSDTCTVLEFDLNEHLLERGELDRKEPVLKTRSDYVKKGERDAKEDMRFPNKSQRREAAQRANEMSAIVRLRTVLSLNANTMSVQRKNEIKNTIEELKQKN